MITNHEFQLLVFYLSDVCRDILTMGGPVVEVELKAGEKRGRLKLSSNSHFIATHSCCLWFVCSKSELRRNLCIPARIIPLQKTFTRAWRKRCKLN